MMMDWLPPPMIFLFALLMRFALVAANRFDGLYGQDAFAYVNYAMALREAVGAGNLPPPFFWPIGYPALIALATLITGPQASTGQLVSLLSGAAVAPLVALIVLECRPRASLGAMAAGLLAAISAQLALYSLAAMSDATGLLWATASAWLLLRTFTHWRTRWLALAALTLALSIMTRWVYGLLVVPWGVAALLAAGEMRLPWQCIASAAAVALLIGAMCVGSQFINSPGGDLSHTGDLRVVGWHPANAIKSSVQNADGFFDYGRPTALYYLRPTFHPAYVFPLFAPFMLLGLLALRESPRSRAALLIGWPLTVYLFLAGIAWQNWRFPLAFFTPLAVLVGLGIDWLWSRLGDHGRPLLLVYCSVALLGSAIWAVRDVGNFAAWANRNRQIALDIERRLPPEATLLAFGLTATVKHYTALDTRELFSLSEQDLREIVSGQGVYLVIDPDNARTQWAGRSPGRHFGWLEEHTVLTPIARHEPFILYEVVP